MSVYVDAQPYQPQVNTVSYAVDESKYSVLIVPKGVTVEYKGKVYAEGRWTVER